MPTNDDGAADDKRLLDSVMGDEVARKRFAPLLESPITATWLAVLREANGTVWNQETLPVRTRVLVNLATLAAVNRPEELAVRVRGLLRGGITPEEIAEVFLHTGLYCGFPAGVEASLILVETVQQLTAEGLLPVPEPTAQA